MGKGGLEYLKYEKPNILCLQEVKCSLEKLPDEIKNVPGYHAYWLCSEKDGYAGVGIYTTKLAINVQYGLQNEDLDSDGRIITAEYEQFYLICTYVPNAGRKLVTLPKRLKWNEEFRKHVKTLDKNKPVIICGDMNVAHNEIGLFILFYTYAYLKDCIFRHRVRRRRYLYNHTIGKSILVINRNKTVIVMTYIKYCDHCCEKKCLYERAGLGKLLNLF